MKIDGFIRLVSSKFIIITFILFSFFFISLDAMEGQLTLTSGVGWKSNVDPVFSFRSAADIFKRKKENSGFTTNFSIDAGIQGDKGNGFMLDFSLSSLQSLQSFENSTLDTGLEGGYIFSINEKNFLAFILGIHNSAFNFKDISSLYVDPYFSISYLYDSKTFYALFLRAGTSYYKSTSSLIEYINGFSSFVEGGARFMGGEINVTDMFAGASFTFFDDQKIKYNRYEDVYYGELDIAGQYYSLYAGLSTEWDVSILSFPLMLKYIYSRSFDTDTHRIVYWSDMEIGQRIYRKIRVDSTVEFSAGVSVDLGDSFSIRMNYLLHKNFSNVGEDFGDYADYSRLAHTVLAEAVYAY